MAKNGWVRESRKDPKGNLRLVDVLYKDGKMINRHVVKQSGIPIPEKKEELKKEELKKEIEEEESLKELINPPHISQSKEELIQKPEIKIVEKKEIIKQPISTVEYNVRSHQYKAGKAWISEATKNWGISGNFVSPVDTVKQGYETTKFFELKDGRYIAESVGSKSHPERTRIEIKDGQIIKEERYSV